MGTSPTVDSVERAALGLSAAARLKLTRALVDSLAGLSEADINQLWLDEAERRDDDFESGRIKGAPGAEVMARIRARHR
jgi:putative addiction module component (TIGR02574 family)